MNDRIEMAAAQIKKMSRNNFDRSGEESKANDTNTAIPPHRNFMVGLHKAIMNVIFIL